MTTTTEALKLAIDTQDAIRNFVGSHGQENTETFLMLEANRALSAVRAALAQQQASVPSVERAFDMLAHLKRQAEFSAKTFGPGARVEGVTDHIAKELREVRESGGDLSEWVDVIILAFDGAWRSGASPAQIIDAMVAKQTKNEGRKWPDWRTAPAGKAIEHDRSGEVGTAPTAPSPLPAALLVRDLAANLSVEPLDVCKALDDLGHGQYSVNMAVPAAAVGAVERYFGAAPQAAPVAPEQVKADGRLHADGYFTWARRDGYVLDKKLPCDFYLTAPAAQPPAAMPGWQWVPVEPTQAMCAAAVKFANGNAVYKNVAAEALKIEEAIYGEAYAAMLAAAPTLQAQSVPATGAQPWQKPGPVTDVHPLECLIVIQSLRQSDGDWWARGDHFFSADSPLAWMPDTPENSALLTGASPTAPTGSAG